MFIHIAYTVCIVIIIKVEDSNTYKQNFELYTVCLGNTSVVQEVNRDTVRIFKFIPNTKSCHINLIW